MANSILDTSVVSSEFSWPTEFPKPVVGVDRRNVFTVGSSMEIIEDALEAIRKIRLKGYKFVMLNDERGRQITDVEAQNEQLMKIFGDAGIMSIDTMFYSIGTEKQDIYVKPSTGMFKRCEREFPHIKFNKGWYVGHDIHDAKAAFKVKARPVLINPTEETQKKLNSFANKKLKKVTKIYDSLAEFEATM